MITRHIAVTGDVGQDVVKIESTGTAPMSVAAQIDKAKHLLILTDWSITDVCMALGFSSLGLPQPE